MATESDNEEELMCTVDTIGVEFSAVEHHMEVHEVLRQVSIYVCTEEARLVRLQKIHEKYPNNISGKKKKQGTFKNRDICSKSLDLQVMVHTIDMFGIKEAARAHNVEPQFLVDIISHYGASQGARLQRLRLAQETYYKGKEADGKDINTKTTCNQQIEKQVELVHTSDEESNVNNRKSEVMKNHKKTAYLFLVFASSFIAYLFMRKSQ